MKSVRTKSRYFQNACKKAGNRINKTITNSKLKYCQDYIDRNKGNPKKM